MKRFALALVLCSGGLQAAATPVVVCATAQGVAVAIPNSVQFFDRNGRVIWNTDGVAIPTAAFASADRIAVVDSINNDVHIADLANGRGKTIRVGETPIEGIFVGRDFFLLERDARTLERISPDGTRSLLALTSDPAVLRQSNGRLYV